MSEPYFAYGSNLKLERLVARVPGAIPYGVAWLPDHTLRCDKHGRDGSGKANLHDAPGERVWGVVYTLPLGGLDALDAFEGGYRRVSIRVQATRAAEQLDVTTYRSDRLLDEPVARVDYRALILEGAREHGLPAAWIAELERIRTRG